MALQDTGPQGIAEPYAKIQSAASRTPSFVTWDKVSPTPNANYVPAQPLMMGRKTENQHYQNNNRDHMKPGGSGYQDRNRS